MTHARILSKQENDQGHNRCRWCRYQIITVLPGALFWLGVLVAWVISQQLSPGNMNTIIFTIFLSPSHLQLGNAGQRHISHSSTLTKSWLTASLAQVNECFRALCQEIMPTQVKSSHELLSRDIKSNLTVASRAETVFKKSITPNQRGGLKCP